MRGNLTRLLGWVAVVIFAAVNVSASSDLRLIDAVKTRDTGAVRALLKARLDVNVTQPDGATALHWAAHTDDLVIADLLLRAGARANVANDLGTTPLYLACTNRSAAMVKRLLAAGADPNATLLRGQTVLMECARTGEAGAVTALLAAGAQVNARESINDQTALMWAVAQQHPVEGGSTTMSTVAPGAASRWSSFAATPLPVTR
jgi:ankyrin repeat protein